MSERVTLDLATWDPAGQLPTDRRTLEELMTRKKPGRLPKGTWAYAYELVPQDEERLRSITAMLERENASAQRGERVWAGRVIHKQQVTHILIVADSPAQDREANHRLEAELAALNVGYAVTAPMSVEDEAPSAPPVKPQ